MHHVDPAKYTASPINAASKMRTAATPSVAATKSLSVQLRSIDNEDARRLSPFSPTRTAPVITLTKRGEVLGGGGPGVTRGEVLKPGVSIRRGVADVKLETGMEVDDSIDVTFTVVLDNVDDAVDD